MRKATLATSALAFVAIVCSALPALAQAPNPNEPKILLHILAPTSKNPCTTYFTNNTPSCAAAHVEAALGSYYVYVVVAKGDSMQDLAGVQLGIYYDQGQASNIADGTGIDMFAWQLCATLSFVAGAPFPIWDSGGAQPNAGILITWDTNSVCQTTAISNAGYFYITAYTDSRLSIIPRPVDQVAKVADCRASESEALTGFALGWAQFSTSGLTPGCNPCLTRCVNTVPVEPTTWSGVKTLFDK